jgi:hypothetical protein
MIAAACLPEQEDKLREELGKLKPQALVRFSF